MANLTGYNVALVVFVCLGGYSFGFAFAVFATSIGQPGFYTYFDLDPTSSYTANIIGAVSSLFAAGGAFGAITQGWTADWLGRRKALALAAGLTLVGGALIAGSVNIPMLVVVRFIQGIGLGQLIALVPLYITETAPSHRRGLLAGLSACSLACGYVFSGWVGYGCYFATNPTVQWRMPLGLSCLSPFLVLSGIYWLPESPRWLSWSGRNEEAWKVLKRLHHDPSDPSESAAQAEFIQITRQVEFDREQKSGYWDMLVKKPSWRRRCLLAMFITFANQSTGTLSITNFAVIIYKELGLKNSMPLLMYCIYVVNATLWNFVGASFLDRIGRRRILLIGFPACAITMLIEAILQKQFVGTENKGGLGAAVLFIFIFSTFEAFCIDPCQFVWAAEIFPTTIRAKGIGLALFAYFTGAITYTTPGALAFSTIGWRYYMVFFTVTCVSSVIVYLYVPETTNMTLEDIGALFGDEVVVHITADGHGIVEIENMDEVKEAVVVHAEVNKVDTVYQETRAV